MKEYIISIDQGTLATQAILFDDKCELLFRTSIPHKQYNPTPGWVEYEPEEIYQNTLAAIREVIQSGCMKNSIPYSIAITNQRQTIVVWDPASGQAVYNAIASQCCRGVEICDNLIEQGFADNVREKTGLQLQAGFSASGIQWILDNVKNAGRLAEQDKLLAGTMDSWLLWKLTDGRVHATDYTNASRTLLFNIHTLDWDEELLALFSIPRSMMPKVYPCDTVFGETDLGGLLPQAVKIAGVLGDANGAFVGQMCFHPSSARVSYDTDASIMVNIGGKPIIAPKGLFTSVGFATKGKFFYAFEGNMHASGQTIIEWMQERLQLFANAEEAEELATSIPDNGGIYFVPNFPEAGFYGLTLDSTKKQIVRAGLEAITYQVKELVSQMTKQANIITLKELKVDGEATKNKFLMQFQSDILDSPVNISNVEEAAALGAVIMNGVARELWYNLDWFAATTRRVTKTLFPQMKRESREKLYAGWIEYAQQVAR